MKRMGLARKAVVQGGQTKHMRGVRVAAVDAARAHVADARITALRVVRDEKGLTVRAGVSETAKACGEVRPVLHRLELRLRVRIVVRDVRAGMALGDDQIDQQGGHGLGALAGHRDRHAA